MRVKKGLKDLDPTNLGFPEGTKIYLNDYRALWNECKKHWNNKKIYSYFTVNVRIKQGENRPYKNITHVSD